MIIKFSSIINDHFNKITYNFVNPKYSLSRVWISIYISVLLIYINITSENEWENKLTKIWLINIMTQYLCSKNFPSKSNNFLIKNNLLWGRKSLCIFAERSGFLRNGAFISPPSQEETCYQREINDVNLNTLSGLIPFVCSSVISTNGCLLWSVYVI